MATNKLIACDDHGSIQLMIPKASRGNNQKQVDPATGIIEPGNEDVFVISGFCRTKGFGDSSLNKLMHQKGLITFPK